MRGAAWAYPGPRRTAAGEGWSRLAGSLRQPGGARPRAPPRAAPGVRAVGDGRRTATARPAARRVQPPLAGDPAGPSDVRCAGGRPLRAAGTPFPPSPQCRPGAAAARTTRQRPGRYAPVPRRGQGRASCGGRRPGVRGRPRGPGRSADPGGPGRQSPGKAPARRASGAPRRLAAATAAPLPSPPQCSGLRPRWQAGVRPPRRARQGPASVARPALAAGPQQPAGEGTTLRWPPALTATGALGRRAG
jgi:hypothetical protein